jgi:hypothetical protein
MITLAELPPQLRSLRGPEKDIAPPDTTAKLTLKEAKERLLNKHGIR